MRAQDGVVNKEASNTFVGIPAQSATLMPRASSSRSGLRIVSGVVADAMM